MLEEKLFSLRRRQYYVWNGGINRKEYCYPVRLQQMLGTKEYQVGNFGVEGVTI